MGNMVVFAVRHKELVANQEFSDKLTEAVGSLINQGNSPVFYEEDKNFFNQRSHQEGLVVSGYYHADTTTYTVVTGECLFTLPYYHLDLTRDNFRKTLTRKLKEKGVPPKAPSAKIADGGAYSLFGLLTDRMSEFEKNPKITASLIKQQSLGFGDYTEYLERHAALTFLGTYGPEASVLIRGYGNRWDCMALPHVDVSLTASDMEEIEKLKTDAKGRYKISDYVLKNVLLPSLMAVVSPERKTTPSVPQPGLC